MKTALINRHPPCLGVAPTKQIIALLRSAESELTRLGYEVRTESNAGMLDHMKQSFEKTVNDCKFFLAFRLTY